MGGSPLPGLQGLWPSLAASQLEPRKEASPSSSEGGRGGETSALETLIRARVFYGEVRAISTLEALGG